MFERSYKAGEFLIKQGEHGDNFYVLDEGVCDCYINQKERPPLCVKTYNYGEGFGELALMYNSPRAASIKVILFSSTFDTHTFTLFPFVSSFHFAIPLPSNLSHSQILFGVNFFFGVFFLCNPSTPLKKKKKRPELMLSFGQWIAQCSNVYCKMKRGHEREKSESVCVKS